MFDSQVRISTVLYSSLALLTYDGTKVDSTGTGTVSCIKWVIKVKWGSVSQYLMAEHYLCWFISKLGKMCSPRRARVCTRELISFIWSSYYSCYWYLSLPCLARPYLWAGAVNKISSLSLSLSLSAEGRGKHDGKEKGRPTVPVTGGK